MNTFSTKCAKLWWLMTRLSARTVSPRWCRAETILYISIASLRGNKRGGNTCVRLRECGRIHRNISGVEVMGGVRDEV